LALIYPLFGSKNLPAAALPDLQSRQTTDITLILIFIPTSSAMVFLNFDQLLSEHHCSPCIFRSVSAELEADLSSSGISPPLFFISWISSH
jgi:hypothetical protein